jgi:hypothetical protein
MTKTLGIILCSAFSVGLVAETAAGVWSLASGQGISLATAIELIIAWLVVLAVFIATIIKGFRGFPRWVGIGVTVVRPDDDDDDGSDDDSDGSDDDSDGDSDGSDDGSDEHPADEPASDETADNAR